MYMFPFTNGTYVTFLVDRNGQRINFDYDHHRIGYTLAEGEDAILNWDSPVPNRFGMSMGGLRT